LVCLLRTLKQPFHLTLKQTHCESGKVGQTVIGAEGGGEGAQEACPSGAKRALGPDRDLLIDPPMTKEDCGRKAFEACRSPDIRQGVVAREPEDGRTTANRVEFGEGTLVSAVGEHLVAPGRIGCMGAERG